MTLLRNLQMWAGIAVATGLIAACGDDGTGGGESDAAPPDAAPVPDAPPPCEFVPLDETLLWYGDTRAALNDLMTSLGSCDSSLPDAERPVAVLDFDETLIKGDAGAGMLFHFLENDLIKKPLAWADTSKHLNPDGLASLDASCPLDTLPDPLPTSTNLDCATAIACIYLEGAVWNGTQVPDDSGNLCDGLDAFDLTGDARFDTIDPELAWAIALQAGYAPAELRDAAQAMFTALEQGVIGSSRTVGYITDLDGYARVYQHMVDLVSKLQQSDFDVWVSSSASQYVLEPLASTHFGIAADHVIGARPVLDAQNNTTVNFEGCGMFPDGNQDIGNVRQGKRCFINKLIFGVSDPSQQLGNPSPTALAAGDSNDDVVFLGDATGNRLVINRNRTEIMCHAYANANGKWLINPQFIEPKGQRTELYACSPFSLPDQEDTVFCVNRVYESQNCNGELR